MEISTRWDLANVYQLQQLPLQEGIEMPEPPKQGFFKGFFGGGAKPLDREELFGGSNASSTIAVKTEGAKMTAAQVRDFFIYISIF